MAAIPTILKGDDSGAISITMATGRTYTGATLVVAYQGVTRSFTNLTPGGTVSLSFTHDETANFTLKTAPMLMRLVNQQGAEETVDNAEARIKVTDCVSEVNAGGAVIVTPGGAVPITDVGDVAARYTLADLQAKVNQIVHVLAQRSLLGLLLSACCLASFGDVSVQTARLDALYNDSLVVTNVTGGGGGGGGSVSTNDILALVNDQFTGGTNAVNAVIANTNALNAKIDAQQATNIVDYLVAVTNVSRGLAPNIDIAILTAGYALSDVTYAADHDAPTETWCYLDYSTNGMALQSRGIFIGNTNRAFNVVSNIVDNDTGEYPITVRIARAAVYETRNRYGLATTNALTSVSNAAVSASALASAALPRAEVTNAVDALVAVTNELVSLSPWTVTSLSEPDFIIESVSWFTPTNQTSSIDFIINWHDNEHSGCMNEVAIYDNESFYIVMDVVDAIGGESTIRIKLDRNAVYDYRNRYGLATTNALNAATNGLVTASVTNGLLSAYDASQNYQPKGSYQPAGDYAETSYVASITNASRIAIGSNSSALSRRLSDYWQTAIGNNAMATNGHSSAFGWFAHSHGDYTINFSSATNNTSAVGSLSQIYFGDFTLRQMVTNDTQLWQDCVSYQLASNSTAAITSPANGSVIQRLNALEGVNALLETALNGGND